jgi:hypothetical protein
MQPLHITIRRTVNSAALFFLTVATACSGSSVAGIPASTIGNRIVGATLTPAPVSTTAPAPTPTGTQAPSTPTPAPNSSSTATTAVYNPPAGTYPFFSQSTFLQPIPSNPTVNANSSTWMSALGTIGFVPLQFAANAAGIGQDYSFPVYQASSGPRAETVKVHCTQPWGTCNVEGVTVSIDPRELPEDRGASGEDSHFALVNTSTGKEYDFWETKWPPQNGVLDIGWGGECSLNGNGQGGCHGDAASSPLSLGILRTSDLMLAIQSSTGSLPYALQTGVKCVDGFVSPAISSDGDTPGCPPEGARAYLAMHDAQVDATSNTPIAKAILRTIDEDHYGMIIIDQNGGQDGFCFNLESDLTYTSFGQPGPNVNQLVPEAQAEGISTNPYNNEYFINPGYTGIDLAHNIVFL